MLVVVLGFLGAGTLALPYLESGRRAEIFTPGQSGSPPAKVSGNPAPIAAGASFSQTKPQAKGPPVAPFAVAPDGRIDLNTAPAEVLDTLPGVGASRAAAIIALRNRKGGFRSVEELDEVPGIGPVTMGKLRPLVTVSAVPAAGLQLQAPPGTPIPRSPQAPGAGGAFQSQTPGPAAEYTGPVNINTAGPEQLETLKYVGPKLAQAIIAHRARYGAFRRPEDLAAVKGIGRRVLESNRGRIHVR